VHVEITSGSIPGAHCTSSGQAQCLAGIDSGRHVDGVLTLIEMTAFTSTSGAGTFNDRAEATATTARPCGDHLAKN
jgi:hypothetical protein